MQHDIAFLHTSALHVATFGRLTEELSPRLRVRHVVEQDLLAQAQLVGADDPALVTRVQQAMKDAAATGASVVVCTCSTVGGAAELTATGGAFVASRIDRAMADRAVALGPRVLVAVALESTLAPTIALIEGSAKALGVQVDIRSLLVADAWQHFLDGDEDAYIRTIAEAVTAAVGQADVVVLAQASMAPAARALSGLGPEVLSSPMLGVQAAVARVRIPPR
jgi:hypothetical protein